MRKCFLLLILLLGLHTGAWGYDAVVNGIYYDLNHSLQTATVTSNPSGYSGVVIIPGQRIFPVGGEDVKSIVLPV